MRLAKAQFKDWYRVSVRLFPGKTNAQKLQLRRETILRILIVCNSW